jgi:hypothetical protein
VSLKSFIFQCTCHDFHFMTFEWWTEDKQQADVMVSASLAIGGRDWDSWKRRLKGIWGILRGRDYGYYEVCLERDDAVKLRNNLNEFLKDSQSNVAGFLLRMR